MVIGESLDFWFDNVVGKYLDPACWDTDKTGNRLGITSIAYKIV